MDKAAYFQSVYEAQFALGKKTGACLSAQYLALEAFLQRNSMAIACSAHRASSGRTYTTGWREGEHCLSVRLHYQTPGISMKPETPPYWHSLRKEIRFTNSPGYPLTLPSLASKAAACPR